MCIGECPVFSVYREEHLSAKSRVILKDKNTKTVDMSDLIWECRTCGTCQKICTAGIPHIKNIIDLRKELIAANKVSVECSAIIKSFREKQNPLNVEEKPSLKLSTEGDVLLWRGCVTRNKAPEIVKPSLAFLRKIGIDVSLMEKEGCCGMPAHLLGDTISAEKNIEKLIKRLSKYKAVISICPTCTIGFKELVPIYLSRNTEEARRKIKLPSFLNIVELIHRNDHLLDISEDSFFQVPCRLSNMYEDKVNNDFVEFIRKHRLKNNINSIGQVQCCSGETFNGTLNDLSKWRIPQILMPSTVKDVITSCPSCYLNFQKSTKKPVKFVTSLLS